MTVQGRLRFSRTKKLWESPIREEHVINEITALLWYQARIPVYRLRERIPDPRWRKDRQKLSTPGLPDLIGWMPTRIQVGTNLIQREQAVPLFIECKRPGKSVRRPAQERFIAEARAGGCIAFFAESWEDVRFEMGKQAGLILREAK